MVIDLRKHENEKLYHALYSDIFAAEDRVYKLFKKYNDPNFDDRSRTKFTAQCDAYVRAAGDTIIGRHVAEYYGACSVERVLDADGVDVTNRYFLDACYGIERLYGPDLKVNDEEILSNCAYVFEIRRRFEDFGIDTSDSSVFFFNDPDRFKLIDFETRAY